MSFTSLWKRTGVRRLRGNSRKLFRNAEQVLSRSHEQLAIRDRRRGVTEVVEVIGGERAKLLWVRFEYGRLSFVVRCVNAGRRENERGTETATEAMFPGRLAGLRVEAAEHALIDHAVEVALVVNG